MTQTHTIKICEKIICTNHNINIYIHILKTAVKRGSYPKCITRVDQNGRRKHSILLMFPLQASKWVDSSSSALDLGFIH